MMITTCVFSALLDGNYRFKFISLAIDLLRYQELEQAYREAAAEFNPEWDLTVGDGLKNESW